MKYVYILRSILHPDKFYIGLTDNLERRLKQHQNPSKSAYTRRFAPWRLETHVCFTDDKVAARFETYLKSHSGRAFLKKRLITGEGVTDSFKKAKSLSNNDLAFFIFY